MSATTTAIGTIASGTTNTSGTNATCVGTVNPNGVSNSIRVASASTSTHRTVGMTASPCGGWISQIPATATAKPAPVMATATRSRVVMPEWRRCSVSASSFCSSNVGSMDIPRDIGPGVGGG